MASDIDIVNRALSRLGCARVNTLGDDTKNGRAAASALAVIRDEVLADHPWNPAVKRTTVYVTSDTVVTITYPAGTSVRVDVGTGHPFKNGDPVSIEGVVGPTTLNGSWVATAVGAATFDLIDPATGALKSPTGLPAYVSGGTVTRRGLWQHDFSFDLPTDLIRLLEVEGQHESDWLVENGKLLTDLRAPLKIRYVYRNTNAGTYPPLLVSALAARLAAELALELVDSPTKHQLALDAYNRILFQAKSADGREQTPSTIEEGRWVTARLTG